MTRTRSQHLPPRMRPGYNTPLPPRMRPGYNPSPPRDYAQVGGTHPTGMHSCFPFTRIYQAKAGNGYTSGFVVSAVRGALEKASKKRCPFPMVLMSYSYRVVKCRTFSLLGKRKPEGNISLIIAAAQNKYYTKFPIRRRCVFRVCECTLKVYSQQAEANAKKRFLI